MDAAFEVARILGLHGAQSTQVYAGRCKLEGTSSACPRGTTGGAIDLASATLKAIVFTS